MPHITDYVWKYYSDANGSWEPINQGFKIRSVDGNFLSFYVIFDKRAEVFYYVYG